MPYASFSLPCLPFVTEAVKITPIHKSGALDAFTECPVASEKIRRVYGSDLFFPPSPQQRPYVFASYVASIDGRLAYADAPSAFFVAAKNLLAEGGKEADFWILNALRGVCDAAVIGGNSLRADEDYAMYCMDAEIAHDRTKAGLPLIPLNIVISLDGSDVPLEHRLLKNDRLPALLSTSPKGLQRISHSFRGKILSASDKDGQQAQNELFSAAGNGVLPVLVTGENDKTNIPELLRILKERGINRLLVESPGFGHALIQEKMMDEFFLNKSGVYIGGSDTMTLGKAGPSFPSDNHPHMQALSIHRYNDYFMYHRYRFIYGD